MHKYFAKIAFNLHYKAQRSFVSIIMPLMVSVTVYSQEHVRPDTIPSIDTIMRPDTLFPQEILPVFDTISERKGLTISPDAVDQPIVYNADGYMKTDLKSKKVSLVQNAQVTYGTIELKADSIVLDMETGSVFATGRIDSTGKMTGKPVYKDGKEEFESKELIYNFKSQKGVIRNVTTEQEGGFLQSDKTKRQEDGTLHVSHSKFTTCDAEHPHFYLALPKAKVYPGEKIVSGPAYMVVADIPLPLVLPFGFFPVQQRRASGIVMPKYGQEARRGYYLSNGGYYFALNDYFDLKLTGTVYTNGTWLADAGTSYRLRYRFSGSFGFSLTIARQPITGSAGHIRRILKQTRAPASLPVSI
jgi:lipopolysaccharide assembly outer membrane protein LptD (OstA)